MITGGQQLNDGADARAVIRNKAVASRKRSARHSRPIMVVDLPPVIFTVPIFYEWERHSQSTAEMVLAAAGELLAVV